MSNGPPPRLTAEQKAARRGRPRPIDRGVVWLGYKGGRPYPEMGYAKPGVPLPENARWWCEPGVDRAWVRVPGEG